MTAWKTCLQCILPRLVLVFAHVEPLALNQPAESADVLCTFDVKHVAARLDACFDVQDQQIPSPSAQVSVSSANERAKLKSPRVLPFQTCLQCILPLACEL